MFKIIGYVVVYSFAAYGFYRWNEDQKPFQKFHR